MNDSLLGVLFIPKDKKVSHYIIINNNEGYFRMEDIINNKQIIDKEKVRRL